MRGNIDQHVDCANQRARAVVQWCRMREQTDTRAVGPLCNHLDAADRPVLSQCDGRRALVMWQRCAVRTAQTPADAPEIAAQLRPATSEFDRSLVVKGDPSGGV